MDGGGGGPWAGGEEEREEERRIIFLQWVRDIKTMRASFIAVTAGYTTLKGSLSNDPKWEWANNEYATKDLAKFHTEVGGEGVTVGLAIPPSPPVIRPSPRCLGRRRGHRSTVATAARDAAITPPPFEQPGRFAGHAAQRRAPTPSRRGRP